MTEDPPKAKALWASIIESVRTPLGFYALVVLIAEGILGGVALLIERPEKTILVWAMIILIFLLTIIVAVFSFVRPEALRGQRPPRVIKSPTVPAPEAIEEVRRIARAESVDEGDIDPKLIRFIPPLDPGRFRIINLPRPQPPPYFNWRYAPTGKLVLYGIPFFLIPVIDSTGNSRGHLVIDVQPSKENDAHEVEIEAKVSSPKVAHLLISAGHGWRMHKGLQFLNRRVGYLRFIFADGSEEKKDLILGRHLREWAFGNNTNLVTEIDDSLARPAWLSHESTRRFDLLSLDLGIPSASLKQILVVAKFEHDHPDNLVDTPSIIVSAITIERSVHSGG